MKTRYLTRQSTCVTVLDDGFYESAFGHEDNCHGGQTFKLDVGAQCNRLLDMAETLEPRIIDETQAQALRSIVSLIAKLESLEVEP